ncbi:MAG: ferritin [Proteobacteria bacterium]|nr:ferritin [Pseudomonadota bacterium]
MTKKDTKQVISALNRSRSAELGAIMQYMGHHYSASGIESLGVKDVFRQSALDEMRHAEMLAERIAYLGGIPTLKVDPVKRGGTLKQMLKDDLDLEKNAIKRYRQQIGICEKLKDYTTRRLLEDILIEEESHADTGQSLLTTGKK